MTEDRRLEDAARALERRASAAFADSVASLDASTRSRLTRARHRALDEFGKPGIVPAWSPGVAGLRLAGLAAAMVLGWLLLIDRGPEQIDAHVLAETSDLELLFGEEELELFEDLEFYAWLDEQTAGASPPEMPDGAG